MADESKPIRTLSLETAAIHQHNGSRKITEGTKKGKNGDQQVGGTVSSRMRDVMLNWRCRCKGEHERAYRHLVLTVADES
jgi:hypothetical protein